MRFPSSRVVALAAVFLLPVAAVAASTFPDVPAAYPHLQAIEALVSRGIITGNPDGTFRPNDPVNRAALLKMLYKGAGITAGEGREGCLSDVERGSWYESIVCDAVSRGFVKGYTDGTFRPARPVSRAEALKMTLLVFALNQQGTTPEISYTDVLATDWFADYVRQALENGILPIPGQEGPTLSPNTPLERGEAAAYIWNVLGRAVGQVSSSSESSSSVSSMAEVPESSSSTSSRSIAAPQLLEIKYPFTDIRSFEAKEVVTYKFSIATATVADIRVTPQMEGAVISCTLLRLENSGFSTEYYMGMQDGTVCRINAALRTGNYQLQLQSSRPGTSFIAAVTEIQGDGNDGFSQAVRLVEMRAQTSNLDANDLEDWFVFTLSQKKTLTISVTSTDAQRCLVYPSIDVALDSFAGPECNKSYLFPAGTYYVGVGHGTPLSKREMFTIQLR